MSDGNEQVINKRYHLHQKLGEGGMGVVHHAHDRLTGNIVALKHIHVPTEALQFMSMPATEFAADLRLSLAHEFQTLASLRHPHIISVLDYGFVIQADEGPQPFYTMTYLPEAETLLQAGQRMSLPARFVLLQQTLQGLIYLHRRGILHRDLKPENVLVAEGRVHILDFGLATRQDESGGGSSSGSVAYLAPELWREQPPSPASDLYALGVMAYELLAGQHPFAPIDSDFLDRVLHAEPDLSVLAVAEGPAQVLAKLLVKEPGARYQQARTVLADLRAAPGQPQPVESQAIRESYLQAATFVGRERELAQLNNALTQVTDGQSAVWLVGGESGVGKTRLVDELRIQAMVKGIAVMRGQAVEGGGLPFQLWREPVRRLLLMQDVPDLQAGILKDLVPDIDSLLGREVPAAPRLDGHAYQQRLILAIVDLFRNLPEPVLLLLEDLQWTSESLAVLQQMQRVIAQLPGVMALGTYRHDERPGLPDELPGSQTLILERLDENEVAQLSRAMLGEAASSPHIVSLLTQETEGNTFFIVEVMRALAEEAGQLDEIGTMTLPEGVFTGGMARLLQRRIQQSLSIYRDIGNQSGVAISLGNLGEVAYHQGDYGQARDYYQQGLSIKRDISNQSGIANNLVNLSFVHLHMHSEQARASLCRSLVIAQNIRATSVFLVAVVGFAWLYMNESRPSRAGELVGLAQHHPAHNSDVQAKLDELLPHLEAPLTPAELHAALERGKALDLDTVVAELLAEFGETDG